MRMLTAIWDTSRLCVSKRFTARSLLGTWVLSEHFSTSMPSMA